MYLIPNNLSPYTPPAALNVPGHGPGKPQGIGPDNGDDAAFARIDVQRPPLEKRRLREHRKRRTEPERADAAGLVSGQAFGVFRGTRLEVRHARKPLELVQGYALIAVHERHDRVPSLPVVEHKAFHDVVFAQPKLPGRVLRAAPLGESILQTPHVLTRFLQNADGRSLFFPVHPSPSTRIIVRAGDT